jgi:hypothetical protein
MGQLYFTFLMIITMDLRLACKDFNWLELAADTVKWLIV